MLLILGFILLQLIWTSSYVAMKLALVSLPIGAVLIFRYGIASLLFFLLGHFRGAREFSKRDWLIILFVGVANYSFSPYFQLKSLQLTQVLDVSILVSMEPLITALFASLLLKEKLTWDMVVVLVISAFGVVILSGVNREWLLAPLTTTRLIGNLFFIGALCCEGLNSTAARHLTQKYRPLTLVAWTIFAGFVANLAGNFRLLPTLPFGAESLRSWLAVLYLAVFCSAIGYGAWYILVKKMPVARLALSLFLQPVIGIFLGYAFLAERIDRQTVIGAGLIVVTLFIWVLKDFYSKRVTAAQQRI